jgi:hypothetical protein
MQVYAVADATDEEILDQVLNLPGAAALSDCLLK